jgi:2'-5' RNA ligase
MRCFISVNLSDEVKRAVQRVIDDLRPQSRAVRWVPAENLHLTLKFLGEVEEAGVDKIRGMLPVVCGKYGSFDITFRGTGVFPNPNRPRVVWIGIDVPGPLADLAREIDEAMSRLGFEREHRAFTPHLTIGRVKDDVGVQPAMKALHNFRETLFGSIMVKEIYLMRSTLKPSGAVYTELAGFPLS